MPHIICARKLIAVSVRFIAHHAQRYPTVGDWYWRHATLQIRISDLQNDEYNMLVAVHEWVEAYLCHKAGVSEKTVTNFDLDFEARRERGEVDKFAEPGDDPDSPYYTQHQIATNIERYLAQALNVDWEAYNAAVNSL